MKIAAAVLALMVATGLGAASAEAQTSLATSPGVQGQNTVQQAPSGGRGGAGAAPAGSATGRPSAEDRQLERRDKAVTQICKGC